MNTDRSALVLEGAELDRAPSSALAPHLFPPGDLQLEPVAEGLAIDAVVEPLKIVVTPSGSGGPSRAPWRLVEDLGVLVEIGADPVEGVATPCLRKSFRRKVDDRIQNLVVGVDEALVDPQVQAFGEAAAAPEGSCAENRGAVARERQLTNATGGPVA